MNDLFRGGWINALFGLSAMYLLAHRRTAGWWLGVLNDVLWIWVGWLNDMPGAMVSAVVSGSVKAYGAYQWNRSKASRPLKSVRDQQ